MAVIDSAFETKGTHLFFVDNSESDVVIRKLTCPTGITGVSGGSKDRIDVTCLDEVGPFRKYVGGFADPAEVSVPFVLYDDDASHAALFRLQKSGQVVGFFVGLSDATTEPTVIDSDDQIEPPTDRTGFTFKGYIANVTVDASVNEVIRGTLTIQPTGDTTFHEAA